LLLELTAENDEQVLELNRQRTDLRIGFADGAILSPAETSGRARETVACLPD
jgi:hypothetical protein